MYMNLYRILDDFKKIHEDLEEYIEKDKHDLNFLKDLEDDLNETITFLKMYIKEERGKNNE